MRPRPFLNICIVDQHLIVFLNYVRGNQEWTIWRNWQHWAHKTQDEDKQNKKHNTENKNAVQHGRMLILEYSQGCYAVKI
jgi:hypothetical protein